MKIGFVSCEASTLKSFFPTLAEPNLISPDPAFTPDDYMAVEALRNNGHDVQAIVWGVNPQQLLDFDLIIIRSPWDYMDSDDNKNNFFAWLHELELAKLPVMNSFTLMRWLLDKHYLQDFAEQGIETIPTQYLPAGITLNLAETFTQQGPCILKQCISAAGIGLFFIDTLQTAHKQQAAFQIALNDNDYMLQPLIPEIKTHGEWSLIFLGGDYSHSILKKPAENSIMVHAERGGSIHFPVCAPVNVLALAHRVHTRLTEKFSYVLYVRIDVIETKNGPVLVECEGVEPELFFRADTNSVKRFVEAVARL